MQRQLQFDVGTCKSSQGARTDTYRIVSIGCMQRRSCVLSNKFGAWGEKDADEIITRQNAMSYMGTLYGSLKDTTDLALGGIAFVNGS